MSFFTADFTSQLAQPDPDAEFLLVNNDTVNPVFISQARPCNTQSNRIAPQGSATLSGWWYVSTLATNITVECFVFPGGSSWSNPVGVQIALGALGLAKDTSVQQVHTDTSAVSANTGILGANGYLGGSLAGALVGSPGNTVAKEVGLTGLNAAVPVKAASYGPFAANTAWGPTAAFTFQIGAAYRIVITPSVPGDAFVTDLTVTHQDAAGNTVYTEDYTVSNIGNSGLTGGTSPQGGVIVRGNLQGPKLVLSGLTISAANFASIGGVGTVSGINITLYSDSYLLPESKPKVIPWVNTGYLAFTQALSILNGGSFPYGILPSYAGRAFWAIHTPTASANFVGRVSSFSVANGTSSLYVQFTGGVTTGAIQLPFQFALDQLLHIYQLNNVGSATGTVDSSIVATDFV